MAYRVVFNNPAREEDFDSHRICYPEKVFNVPECIVRSCSLFESISQAVDLARKKQKSRGMPAYLLKIELTENAGKVERGKNSHISWWIHQPFLVSLLGESTLDIQEVK